MLIMAVLSVSAPLRKTQPAVCNIRNRDQQRRRYAQASAVLALKGYIFILQTMTVRGIINFMVWVVEHAAHTPPAQENQRKYKEEQGGDFYGGS